MISDCLIGSYSLWKVMPRWPQAQILGKQNVMFSFYCLIFLFLSFEWIIVLCCSALIYLPCWPSPFDELTMGNRFRICLHTCQCDGSAPWRLSHIWIVPQINLHLLIFHNFMMDCWNFISINYFAKVLMIQQLVNVWIWRECCDACHWLLVFHVFSELFL